MIPLKEKISIVVPIYNAEKYIENTVKCITNQTHSNIEIILVDDGSKDQSLKIIKNLSKKEKRIKVVHQENKGVSAARNKGISLATGEYLTFVDADDFLEPKACEILYNNIKKYNSDISIASVKKINIANHIVSPQQTNKIYKYSKEELLKIFFVNDGSIDVASANAKLYSKRIYKKIFFAENRNSNEDRYYLFESILKCNTVIVFQDTYIYTYKMHANSLSTSKVNERLFDNIYFAKKMIKEIKALMPNLYNIALYNYQITTMWVYRNFYRYKDIMKEYKKPLKAIRKEIINTQKTEYLSVSKKIEIVVIHYFNYLYYWFIKIGDKVRKYER